ncbi:MAG: cache domain-containing protein [Campylobacterota bacterium]|nr:cache domain-containing protein [Campylobacterota bacterium]
MGNLTISKKIVVSVLAVSLVAFISAFLILSYYKGQTELYVHKDVDKTLQTSANNKIFAKKSVGISNAVSIANDSAVKESLKTNDRKLAIKALSTLGANMKASTEFKNIKVHIHTKENNSFVRAWKPEKFGDDLSGFRHSIVKANAQKVAVNTFELGKAGLSIRSVLPIIDKGTHLGSLEFIQGLNSVARSFDREKDAFLLLMDKRVSTVKTFKEDSIFKTHYVISQKFRNKPFMEDANSIDMKELFDKNHYISDKYYYTYIDRYKRF